MVEENLCGFRMKRDVLSDGDLNGLVSFAGGGGLFFFFFSCRQFQFPRLDGQLSEAADAADKCDGDGKLKVAAALNGFEVGTVDDVPDGSGADEFGFEGTDLIEDFEDGAALSGVHRRGIVH